VSSAGYLSYEDFGMLRPIFMNAPIRAIAPMIMKKLGPVVLVTIFSIAKFPKTYELI